MPVPHRLTVTPRLSLRLAFAMMLCACRFTAQADEGSASTAIRPPPPRLSVLMGVTQDWQQSLTRAPAGKLLDRDLKREIVQRDASGSFNLGLRGAAPRLTLKSDAQTQDFGWLSLQDMLGLTQASAAQAETIRAGEAAPAALPERTQSADYAASSFATSQVPAYTARSWTPEDFPARAATRDAGTFANPATVRAAPALSGGSQSWGGSAPVALAASPAWGALSAASSFGGGATRAFAPPAAIHAALGNAPVATHPGSVVTGSTAAGGLSGSEPRPALPADPASTIGTNAVFTGPGLTINDGAAANPYPSTLTVSGLANIPATGNNVTLTINNFSRPGGRPDDIDMLLVGPTGASLIFWSDVGSTATTAINITVTLSDAGTNFLPDAGTLTSGTFKPTNESTVQDNFAQYGAPAGPYGTPGGAIVGVGPNTFATQFNGTNPNGVWSLYVVDDVQTGETGGSIGSWSLSINAAAGVPEPSTWIMGAAVAAVAAHSLRRRLRAA